MQALVVGDRVQTAGGATAILTGLAEVMLPDTGLEVFNFEVDTFHTYYAGGILVHNNSGELFDSFKLSKEIFHSRFDYDFRNIVDGPGVRYSRGGVQYRRPIGSDRKALRVAGMFEDDRWLAADDASSTWPVAYHGTAAVNMEPITRDKGLKAGGKDGVKRTNGARFGTGIYVSPLPEFALRYATECSIGTSKRRYKVVFQCRVRPGSYTRHNPGPAPWDPSQMIDQEWVVPSSADVRPYGICIYEL